VALAGAAILFGGIAAYAGAQSVEVRKSWKALGDEISRGSLEDAKVFIPALQQMALDLGQSFEEIRPQIRDAFAAAAPLVTIFTDGITGLVKNAMPGFVHVLQDARPVMEGFATFAEKIGSGLAGFFDNMVGHSGAAGADLASLGSSLGSVLELLGTLLGDGAELAQVVLPPLAAVLGAVANVAEKLSGILPGLAGGFLAMKSIGAISNGLQTFASKAPAAISTLTGSAAAGEKAGAGLTKAAGAVDSLSKASLALPVIGIAVSGLASEHEQSTSDTEKWAQALLKGGDAAKQAYKEYRAGTNWQFAIDEAIGLKDNWDDVKNKAKELADSGAAAGKGIDVVTRAAADSSRTMADVPGVYTSAAGAVALVGKTGTMTEAQMESATQKIIDFRNQLQTVATSFVDPLASYQQLLTAKTQAEHDAAAATAKATADSSDSWVDYAQKVDVTLGQLADSLETQIQNQLNWRANIVKIAGWAGFDVAQYLAQMGKDGVDIVAKMADGTSAEAQRMAQDIRTDIQLGGNDWAANMTLAMKVMAEKGKEGASATAKSVADALGVGLADVQLVANQYGIVLANGVNPLLQSLGRPVVDPKTGRIVPNGTPGAVPFTGPVVTRKADGGVESHTAQIAPAGAWRVWAEPETGGEAYIPLAASKRSRSIAIWQKTGELLGMGVQSFVFGGINDVPKPPASKYNPPISTAQDAALGTAYDAVIGFMKQFASAVGPSAGAGVQRWLPLVLQSLAMIGQPASLAQTVLRRMQQESGGNPNAINLWDSNARAGYPSQGLMQTIPSTFARYHFPGTSFNIMDPWRTSSRRSGTHSPGTGPCRPPTTAPVAMQVAVTLRPASRSGWASAAPS
jgi:hypothetical protein